MVEQAPELTIRDAGEADAAACAAIYRPFVLETAVSFANEPETVTERRQFPAHASASPLNAMAVT